jgi:hypothetical protein
MSTIHNVRLPDDLREQLRDKAKEENRTLSNVIITILLEYFKD